MCANESSLTFTRHRTIMNRRRVNRIRGNNDEIFALNNIGKKRELRFGTAASRPNKAKPPLKKKTITKEGGFWRGRTKRKWLAFIHFLLSISFVVFSLAFLNRNSVVILAPSIWSARYNRLFLHRRIKRCFSLLAHRNSKHKHTIYSRTAQKITAQK